ncbi:hypothetical protein DFH07DRAFT_1020879 [Mycena maculata]|uniref:Uncharacterized protein n=1 Tax=Mycena maculata TaxID=230809 RepID=A0AAD7JEV4_9AGAR|nr:hypothetical protein DFH07DRAFT_1020879 [Mycena maculata]
MNSFDIIDGLLSFCTWSIATGSTAVRHVIGQPHGGKGETRKVDGGPEFCPDAFKLIASSGFCDPLRVFSPESTGSLRQEKSCIRKELRRSGSTEEPKDSAEDETLKVGRRRRIARENGEMDLRIGIPGPGTRWGGSDPGPPIEPVNPVSRVRTLAFLDKHHSVSSDLRNYPEKLEQRRFGEKTGIMTNSNLNDADLEGSSASESDTVGSEPVPKSYGRCAIPRNAMLAFALGTGSNSKLPSRGFPSVPVSTNLSLLIHVPSTGSNDQKVIHLPTQKIDNAQRPETYTPPSPPGRTSSKRLSIFASKSPKPADNSQRPQNLIELQAERLDPDNCAW